MAPNPQGQIVPNAQYSGWAVTGQQETVMPGPDGRPAAGWNVQYRSRDGHYGTVFMPMSLYTPDNVRAAVVQAAMTADAVGTLKG